jgi:hypothetical protein
VRSSSYPQCQDCGKKFLSEDFLTKHIQEVHPESFVDRRRGWATPHGFVDFSKPVSYDEACTLMKELSERINGNG